MTPYSEGMESFYALKLEGPYPVSGSSGSYHVHDHHPRYHVSCRWVLELQFEGVFLHERKQEKRPDGATDDRVHQQSAKREYSSSVRFDITINTVGLKLNGHCRKL